MMTARRVIRFALLTVGLAAILTAPAAAQTGDCAPRDSILGKLQHAFNEKTVNVGVTAKGERLEVLVAPSGSWTVLISIPGGPTCVASHGDGWRAIEVNPEEHVSAPATAWDPGERAALVH